MSAKRENVFMLEGGWGWETVVMEGAGGGVVFISVLDPDSGFRRAKMTHKDKKVKKFHVLKCWMFS
jgi:hypothetical protein